MKRAHLLLIVIGMLSLVKGENHKAEKRVSPVNHRQFKINGIFFDKTAEMLITADRYVLVIDEDLVHLSGSFSFLETQASLWAARMAEQPLYQGTRELLLGLFKTSMRELLGDIKEIEHMIIADKTITTPGGWKKKRELIPGSGKLMQLLFGVVTTADMEELHSSIEALTKSNDKLIEVQRLQALYINGTRSLAETTAEEVMNLATHLERHSSEVGMTMSFMTAVQYILFKCHIHVRDLRNGWEAVSRGRLSTQTLHPEQLLEALTWVALHLPHDLQMVAPPSMDTLNLYYDMAKVVAGVSGNKIRLFVYIPLSGPNRFFMLYRARPIPMFLPNSSLAVYIEPESEYFAITADRTHFATLTTEDLMQCESKSITLCEPLWPIRKRNEKSCLYALFTQSPQPMEGICNRRITASAVGSFLRAKESETWLYSLPGEVNAYLQCPPRGQSHAVEDTFRLRGTGTVKVAQGCYLHTDTMKLMPRIAIYQNVTKQRRLNVLHSQFESLLTRDETPILQNPTSQAKLREIITKLEGPLRDSQNMQGVSLTAVLQELDQAQKLNNEAKIQLEKSRLRFQYLNWSIFGGLGTIVMISLLILACCYGLRCARCK